MKVHNPLLLTEHFEALVGTSGYIKSISETRQHLSDKHGTCEGLEADISRHGLDCPVLLMMLEPLRRQRSGKSPRACSGSISRGLATLSGKHLLPCWEDAPTTDDMPWLQAGEASH